ncbi:hypothetical protein L6164_020066 [Bauhinia variegata]|uniref:Uncharacterized protein n=1 Tax=Bauhinia variegata TaxID=167791 RepID=A0ACB9MU65_BAUVA|nr:hypothetical protein L6164_020066 [Bauhinia variegata]
MRALWRMAAFVSNNFGDLADVSNLKSWFVSGIWLSSFSIADHKVYFCFLIITNRVEHFAMLSVIQAQISSSLAELFTCILKERTWNQMDWSTPYFYESSTLFSSDQILSLLFFSATL